MSNFLSSFNVFYATIYATIAFILGSRSLNWYRILAQPTSCDLKLLFSISVYLKCVYIKKKKKSIFSRASKDDSFSPSSCHFRHYFTLNTFCKNSSHLYIKQNKANFLSFDICVFICILISTENTLRESHFFPNPFRLNWKFRSIIIWK